MKKPTKLKTLKQNVSYKTGEKIYSAFIKIQRKLLKAKSLHSKGNKSHPGLPYLEIGNRDRPTIILIHGFGDEKDGYLHPSFLLKKEYHLIIPDLPGFGDNPQDSQRTYGLDFLSESINVLIEELELKNIHVMGNSLGGSVSMELCLNYPDKFKSLTLIDTAGCYIEEYHSAFHEYLNGNNIFQVTSREEYLGLLNTIFEKLPPLPSPIFEFLYKKITNNHDWYGKMMDDLIGLERPISLEDIESISFNKKIQKIKQPTLILWGENDKVFPLEISNYLEREIPNSYKHIIPNCGHAPQYERYSDFVKGIKKFLNSIE